ncbi:SLC17A8 [Branchiostoma lanceolatum]|uniref:Sialin n=1 Tax=Branchiostoma lanceolatum TaxID=7740 RepID=A0A8K0ENW6_BRALA|nr:SLC17A8 [Branchiostoma lanceolatum]
MAEPADKPEGSLTESPDATEESPEEMEMNEIFQEKPASSHAIHPDGNERPPISHGVFGKIPKRYIVAFMAFLGFCNVYMLRVNLSVAIVAMVSNMSVEHEDGTVTYIQEFYWDSKLQGMVLGSFFYGYIVTQIPGGWLATKFGGKVLFGGGIAMTALLTLFTPLAIRGGAYTLMGVRIVEGLFEGVTYPSIHAIWKNWAPPLERSQLATAAFSGSYVGTFLCLPICGVLAEHVGWPSIFYVFGALGLVWFVGWWFIVTDSPATHSTISYQELEYIRQTIIVEGGVAKEGAIPWKKVLTSGPVWAILVAHFCENWGFYTMLTSLPLFLQQIFHYDLDEDGVLSAVPYLVMAVVVMGSGQLADFLRQRQLLSTTAVRKIFNCTAFVIQAIFMTAVAFTHDAVAAISCLTVAIGVGGLAWSGFSVNHLDIAPQYASLLMGVSNCIATIPGIVSPSVVGQLVQHKLATEWEMVFFIAAGVYLFGAIIYAVFASGELQPWAEGSVQYVLCSDEDYSEADKEGMIQDEEEEEDVRRETGDGKEDDKETSDSDFVNLENETDPEDMVEYGTAPKMTEEEANQSSEEEI